jgi:serine/threonine protein phosphatase PrpC
MILTHKQIHQQGQRQNNEDFLLADEQKHIYIVCDGVGGANKGEEASKLAANSFLNFLSSKPLITEENLHQALQNTEQAFDSFTNQNPESEGMATTLTFLHFFQNKAIIAHCGDSRIYQVRDGVIVNQTIDHSFVQELVNGGYISAEAALTHPKRNQITRAIQSTKKSTALDVKIIEDILPNDIFMLCSDGILEGIDNNYIEDNCTSDVNIEQLKTDIELFCEQQSKDNFTAILIKIIQLDKSIVPLIANENIDHQIVVTPVDKIVNQTIESSKETDIAPVKPSIIENAPVVFNPEPKQHKKFKSFNKWLLLPLFFILGAIIWGVTHFLGNDKKNKTKIEVSEEIVSDKIKAADNDGNSNKNENKNDDPSLVPAVETEEKTSEVLDSIAWYQDKFNKELKLFENPNMPFPNKIKGLQKLKDNYKNNKFLKNELSHLDTKIKELETPKTIPIDGSNGKEPANKAVNAPTNTPIKDLKGVKRG